MKAAITRRIGRLEARHVDFTGLKPHSEAWFAFWEEKLDRLWAGEDIGNVRIPIEVTDRIIAAADAEDEKDKPKAHESTQRLCPAQLPIVEEGTG